MLENGFIFFTYLLLRAFDAFYQTKTILYIGATTRLTICSVLLYYVNEKPPDCCYFYDTTYKLITLGTIIISAGHFSLNAVKVV